jgi:hypothetical protein
LGYQDYDNGISSINDGTGISLKSKGGNSTFGISQNGEITNVNEEIYEKFIRDGKSDELVCLILV